MSVGLRENLFGIIYSMEHFFNKTECLFECLQSLKITNFGKYFLDGRMIERLHQMLEPKGDIEMFKEKVDLIHVIPKILQKLLNASLVFLAIILSILLIKELFMFSKLLIEDESNDYKLFLESILVFFLYFEFITMIVKYYKENYHFPLRYFIYIGITAMIRLIIVEHSNPISTLLYSFVILVLIIGYFIMNLTPRDRPESSWFFKR